MSQFPNGIHPDERRMMALGLAVECTESKQDHALTRQAAESFDAFLRGEAQVVRTLAIVPKG